jgi:hypothetical protein
MSTFLTLYQPLGVLYTTLLHNTLYIYIRAHGYSKIWALLLDAHNPASLPAIVERSIIQDTTLLKFCFWHHWIVLCFLVYAWLP